MLLMMSDKQAQFLIRDGSHLTLRILHPYMSHSDHTVRSQPWPLFLCTHLGKLTKDKKQPLACILLYVVEERIAF